MKKGFSIIMAFVTVMTMLFSGATFADDTNENTENKTKESNFTNLIVFANNITFIVWYFTTILTQFFFCNFHFILSFFNSCH